MNRPKPVYTSAQPAADDRVLLIHHSANREHDHPASSLAGLRCCLEAGAKVVEVDINALRDGDFALLHDDQLEHSTDGSGSVSELTAAQVRSLRHRQDDTITSERVGLLSEAILMIQDYDHFQELQLDLKIGPALTDAALRGLLEMVAPVRGRVRVTSGADWTLRYLRALDAELQLGFDPLLYMEIASHGEGLPPFRQGAYEYWDDHPLATRRWGTTAAYLAARAEALWVQAPSRAIWYIRASLLAQALDDGFDWIAFLHARSTPVDAWTLDANKPGRAALAQRLVSAGIDRITTNNAPALAVELGDQAVF